MNEVFYDRLYDKIFLSKADLALLEQPRVIRARGISLSAVPSRITNFCTHADRLEHCIGAAELPHFLHHDFEPYRPLLHRALFLHDINHPPFSHVTDPYLENLTGKNHEDMIEEILLEKPIQQIIEGEKLSPEDVLAVINGKFPFIGKLVNGSIDLDNLDNTLRYGISGGITSTIPYSPQSMAQAFRLIDGSRLVLHSKAQFQLDAWKTLRDEVYKVVYGNSNLRAGMMLQRALDLAFQEGKITTNFFNFTDEQAIAFLETKAGRRAKKLIAQVLLRRFYQNVYNLETTKEPVDERAQRYYKHWRGRNELVDQLALDLRLDLTDLCANVGVTRGAKSIDLPFWSEELGFQPQPYEHTTKTYLVRIYLNPSQSSKAQAVAGLAKEIFE